MTGTASTGGRGSAAPPLRSRRPNGGTLAPPVRTGLRAVAEREHSVDWWAVAAVPSAVVGLFLTLAVLYGRVLRHHRLTQPIAVRDEAQ
ncbi:hypothetical protein FB157_13948 [Streptomyces sp. BK340]|nr:hypothetical protein FB157_13948 [Streptomyces sp. BK340]